MSDPTDQPIPLESELAVAVAPSPGDIPDYREWAEAVRVIEGSIQAVIPEGDHDD